MKLLGLQLPASFSEFLACLLSLRQGLNPEVLVAWFGNQKYKQYGDRYIRSPTPFRGLRMTPQAPLRMKELIGSYGL